jgi:hypothetical protein
MITRLETQLGRALDRERHHAVATLNDVTPDMLEDLRRIGPELVNTYLKYHLAEGSEPAFEDFTRDVIRDGKDPEGWGFRDVLAILKEKTKGAALAMTVEGTRAALAAIEGERWLRLSLDGASEANRRAADSGRGAPGVLVRGAPYWWAARHLEVSSYFVSTPMDPISDAGFAVALRRWIALRAAWWAMHARVDLATSTPAQVGAAIGVAPDSVSVDGAIALTALLREARLAFDPATQLRGYVAPDAWFAG